MRQAVESARLPFFSKEFLEIIAHVYIEAGFPTRVRLSRVKSVRYPFNIRWNPQKGGVFTHDKIDICVHRESGYQGPQRVNVRVFEVCLFIFQEHTKRGQVFA